jgi:hypothetical protein
MIRTAWLISMLLFMAFTASCKKESASNHEGQGQVLSADPEFEIRLKLGDAAMEVVFPSQQLAIYESRPAKQNQTQLPQGFELRGENFTLAGVLPDNLKLAPQTKFGMLVNQPLKVLPRGGDPALRPMSKLSTSDGRVFVATHGTITPSGAFNRGDAYAGLSGSIDCELQEIKLGDTDDPNNKGDQPIGKPFKATGTFTAKAASYPFEQL